MMQTRPPPFAYGLVLFLGAAMAPFLLSLEKNISIYSNFSLRRRLSNGNGSVYSLKDAEQFSNLQATHEIDPSIEKRAQMNDAGDRCSHLFLYLPDLFAIHGHGSQMNAYISGVTTSTYLNRAMVLVEPPLEKIRAGGSQFGCPIDAFHETRREWQIHEDFPRGFSRLVQHPAWLSHGCEVPCADTHGYSDWVKLAKGGGEEITCTNSDGTESNVVVLGGHSMRAYYDENAPLMTRYSLSPSPHPQATQWALNLGATPLEAELFSNMKDSRQIWDYVLGLMNKAGFLKFQPWIARDVELFLKSFGLPLQTEYDAIHVRRGDKLKEEAREDVREHWKSLGHNVPPVNYVPFSHYLSQWDGPEKCPIDDEGAVQVMNHNVYIATDDPIAVRKEIAALSHHTNNNTILWNDCHELTFYFNPTDDSSFHLNGDVPIRASKERKAEIEATDSCFGRYHRNIASIADMMILSKAHMFIGEYNSNWGRLVRTMRVRLSAPVAQDDGGASDGQSVVVGKMVQGGDVLTMTLDSRIAWGPTREQTPGY